MTPSRHNYIAVVGLARCATTSVQAQLSQQPWARSHPIKEANFFIGQLSHSSQIFSFERDGTQALAHKRKAFQSIDDFYEIFDPTGNYITVDASPLYSTHPESISAMAEINNLSPVFALLTRDPFERAWSHYKFSVARGEEWRTFEQALIDEERGAFPRWILGGYQAGSNTVAIRTAIKQNFPDAPLIQFDIDQTTPAEIVKRICHTAGKTPLHTHDRHLNKAPSFTSNTSNWYRRISRRIKQLNPIFFEHRIFRSTHATFLKTFEKPRANENFEKERARQAWDYLSKR